MSDRAPKAVPAEELNASLDELMALAAERGRVARRAKLGPHAGIVTERPDKADITNALREDLRDALEDEIVPAVEAAGGARISEHDIEREIVKKALVSLKLHTLKRIAEDHRLDKRGRAEEVAERLARAYRFDHEAIARLILDHEEEPQPERGHTHRLFPIGDNVDIPQTRERLSAVVDRYIRVGVARWFVFSDLDVQEDSLELHGTVRSYRAFVTSEGSEPSLGASPTEFDTEVELLANRGTAHVGGNVFTARSAMRALEIVSGVERLHYVPFRNQPRGRRLATFEPRTVFLLDLVYNRLTDAGVHDRNLTIARFQTADEEASARPEEAERPSLRAVRFEGDHLLDSPEACSLIAREARALVDISLWVNADIGADERAWFPLHFSIQRDHVQVVTGFGRHRPELAGRLHRRLLDQIDVALEEGPTRVDRLEALAETIEETARTGRRSETPRTLRS